MRRSALVVVAVPLIAACSLLTSLDGYTGGGSSTSAQSDATTDGATTIDAGGAGDAGDAGKVGPWCPANAPDASFCVDFDSVPDLSSFDGNDMKGGTIARDGTVGTSPPASLVVTAPATNGGQPGTVRVTHTSKANATEITLAADVRGDVISPLLGANNLVEVFIVVIDDNAGQPKWEAGFGVDQGTAKTFAYQYTYSSSTFARVVEGPSLPSGTWSRVALHIVLGPAPGSGTLDLAVNDFKSAAVAVAPVLAPPRPYVTYFGLPYIDVPHGGWTLHLDNVVVDAR